VYKGLDIEVNPDPAICIVHDTILANIASSGQQTTDCGHGIRATGRGDGKGRSARRDVWPVARLLSGHVMKISPVYGSYLIDASQTGVEAAPPRL
jgi:hypothetical protein